MTNQFHFLTQHSRFCEHTPECCNDRRPYRGNEPDWLCRYPKGLPKGEARDQIVTVMDWFPTFLDLAEIAPPKAPFDGKSMLPLIHDASVSTAHPVLHFGWANEWAVCEGDWKLIGRTNRSNPDKVRTSLHNLADTEPEVKNRAAEHPDIVARLTDLHHEWSKEVTPQD